MTSPGCGFATLHNALLLCNNSVQGNELKLVCVDCLRVAPQMLIGHRSSCRNSLLSVAAPVMQCRVHNAGVQRDHGARLCSAGQPEAVARAAVPER